MLPAPFKIKMPIRRDRIFLNTVNCNLFPQWPAMYFYVRPSVFFKFLSKLNVLLMTVLFHDVYDRIRVDLLNNRLPHIRYSDTLYADDTLLITNGAHCMIQLLRMVEQFFITIWHSTIVNVMCFVGREPGKDISKTKAALTMLIILGIWAVRFPKMHASLLKLMGELHRPCPIAWKFAADESIVCSRLAYGLETLQHNSRHLNRPNAFEQRGLRRVLKLPPTFINIHWTNARN